MNATLPNAADLTPEQALIEVLSYEDAIDSFLVNTMTEAFQVGWIGHVPAPLLPMLVHEYGEPSEFVGRSFLVEQSAPRAQYNRVRGALLAIVEDTQLLGSRDRKPVDAAYIAAGERALNATPDLSV